MKCACTESEICEAHRLVWDFQLITQKLGNQLEAELDSQKLYNQLPTVTLEGEQHESRSSLPVTIPERV